MDFDLRDWLLILGPVFVIAVLLHGYWRMRASRSELKMSLDKSFMSAPGERMTDDEDIDMLRAELPGGHARVRQNSEVPVLMEPVEDETAPEAEADEDDEQAGPVEDVGAVEDDFPAIIPAEDRARVDTRADAAVTAADDDKPVERPEYFVVLYVTATGGKFSGQALLECLVDHEMQFGEMNLFHRFGSRGEVRFSLVNAVEPGTFDLNTMATLETPAVSVFMRAHEQDEPLEVFDEMVSVAEAISDELGGEVRDERRSVLTPQTIEHCRDNIRTYQLEYR